MKHLSWSLHQRSNSRDTKMIIQDPADFFQQAEEIISINLVDTVERFASMVERFLVQVVPAITTVDGSKVVLTKDDKVQCAAGEPVPYNQFFDHTGYVTINGGEETYICKKMSRKLFKNRSTTTVAAQILIAFIKDDIARRSNWEAVYDLKDAIEDYIDPQYDITEVYDYISERLDPFLMTVKDHYYNKDWSIFETAYDGYRLTIKRYGDWRAYMWNKEKFDAELNKPDEE